MKKLLTILLILILFSCTTEKSLNDNKYEHLGGTWFAMEYAIQEKIIDECEYIIIFGTEGRNIIHKANCKNNFHSCK